MKDVLTLDEQLFLYLNNLGTTTFDPFWLLVTSTWVWLPMYFIFAYLLFKFCKPSSLLFVLLFLGLGVAVSDQVSGIFKESFLRLRPCNNTALQPLMRMVKTGGKYGFYSAHASNSFFLASYLSLVLFKKIPKFPYFIFSWAFVVTYSRIYVGVHYPLDVLVGALAGSGIGVIFYLFAKKFIRYRD